MLQNDLSGSTLRPSRISDYSWRWLDVGLGLKMTQLTISLVKLVNTLYSTCNAHQTLVAAVNCI